MMGTIEQRHRRDKMNKAEIIMDRLEGVLSISVSDRQLAAKMKCKHLRSGKIEKGHPVKEARGVEVHGYGYDELGNIIALCKDGKIRQYIRGAA
jgi:hypothetical protein